MERRSPSARWRTLESLRAALAGCQALFHVAADYRIWVPDPEAMMRTNVEGTRSLMREAMAAGVERIVYTSSVATLGLKSDGTPADEDTPDSPGDIVGPYKRSKYEAEQVVRRMVADDGLPAVIVNPSTPGRPPRRQADTHRPHHRGGGVGPDAGLCRYGAEPRPCR